MQRTTTTVRLLCITDSLGDCDRLCDRLGFDEWVAETSVTSSVEEAVESLDGDSVDCVLCEETADEQLLNTVRTVRGEFPSMPIVAFVDGHSREFVDDVIEAGATDLVQSTPSDVSARLLRRRIEGVIESTSIRSARDQTLEHYETILNTAVDGIYQLDSDGTIVAVNDAAVELTGYDRTELIGSDPSIVIDDADIQHGQGLISQALEDEEDDIQTMEMDVHTKDGETIPCETRIAILRRDGEFDGTVGVIRDVSEQRAQERKLRERDEMLKQISKNVNDVVWMTSPEKDEMEFVSAAYEDIWGRPQAELYENPDSFVEGVHPADRERVEAALERQQTDPDSYDETYRVVQPDGDVRWVHDRAFGVYEDGDLERIVGVAQDVTERKEAERQLKSERDMFAQGPVVVFRWRNESEWSVEYVSENVTDLLEYAPEELESGEIPYEQVVHEDDRERVQREVENNSDESTERFSHEPYRVVMSDGDVKWVKDTTKIVREDGEISHYLGYLVDITERKCQERELSYRKALLEAQAEATVDGFLVVGDDQEVLYYNERFLELWDIPENVAQNRSDEELIDAVRDLIAELDEFEAKIDYLYDNPFEECRDTIELTDGRWLGRYSTPVVRDGTHYGRLWVFRDITEQKEREHALQTERDLVEQILETSPVGILVIGDDSEIVEANERAAEIFGVERSFLLGLNVDDVDSTVYDERGEPIPESEYPRETVLETGEPVYGWEAKLQRDGQEVWVSVNGAPLVDDSGEVSQVVMTFEDITERKQAQFELRAEKEFTDQLIDSLDDVLYLFGEGGDFRQWNETLEEVTGYDHEEIAQREPTDFFDETDAQRIEATIEEVLETGSATVEADLITKDGERIPYEFTGSLLTGQDGTRLVCGIGRDVTERNERERELEDLKEEYEMMVETVGDIIYTLDEDYYFMSVNGAAEDITGYTCEELEGAHLSLLLSDEDIERGLKHRRKVIEDELETGSIELDLHQKDGSITPVEFRYRALPFEDEFRGTAGVVRDISDRRARERKIENQRNELAQLDRLNAVIRDVDQALVGAESRQEIEQLVCDRLTSAGQYYFALALRATPDDRLVPYASTNVGEEYVDAAFPIEKATPENSPGIRSLETGTVQVIQRLREDVTEPWQEAALEADIESLAAIPVVYDDQKYGVIGVYAEQQDAFTERELEVLGELGETIGYAIAAVERREREETLTSLYEAMQALLGTETEQEVSDVVVDVGADVLDLPGVGIFLFDDDENVLELVAVTDTLLEFYSGTTTFGPGRTESEAWHSYASGEIRVFDDIRESDRRANPDTDARSALVIPLGDHGVFVAASEAVGIFDEQKRRLVGLLAATTEAALDRVAGRASIRERDEELKQRTRRLEQFDRLNDLLRDVAGTVVHSTARADIEQAVCDRLVAKEDYAFAWIGAVPADDSAVEPRTWAGGNGEYLDGAPLSLDAEEPGVSAAASGDVTVVDNVTDHLRESSWAQTAVEYGFQSAIAIPLVYGETTYGTLTIYATAPNAFDETTRAVLEDVGELVAYESNVAETKQGILAEQVTELELRIQTPNTFLNAVAELADDTVQYREITPAAGGDARVLFELSDPPVGEVLALESRFLAVESLSHVERGDRHLFRAQLSEETVAGVLLECGAIPHSVRASADETIAVVHLPQQLDVREFLDRIRDTYPETELASRRDVNRRAAGSQTVRSALETELTDRQHEVLVTAYKSGFFQSPRETTGAELADLLGVSQPTVTHHLREAQRRLFQELLDNSEG